MCSVESIFGPKVTKWYAPIELYRQSKGEFYYNNPRMARFTFIATSACVGLIQPIIFPIEAAIGSVAMPIIAILGLIFNWGTSRDWMKAWVFSVLGVGLCLTFMAMSAFYLPLIDSALIYIGVISISIAIHVYRAARDPNPLLPITRPLS